MTTRPSRLRRFFAWAWRGQRLHELKQQQLRPSDRHLLEEVKSCQTIAWRTLGGLEPVPAATREAVARPLLITAIRKCLPLLNPAPASVAELFDDSGWQERFAAAGVGADAQPSVKQWLLELPDESNPIAAGQQALLALNAVLETLQQTDGAIRRLRWHRVRVLTAALLILASLVGVVSILATPPEGPDLAVGKPWQASSAYPAYQASGRKPTNPTDGAFFCTNEDTEPWWKLDLQASRSIGGATIVNRGDCCLERAPPLVIELSTDGQKWREVARTTEAFRTWRPTFKATNARYVRLRSLRRTFLHLKDVRIHAPRGR